MLSDDWDATSDDESESGSEDDEEPPAPKVSRVLICQ